MLKLYNCYIWDPENDDNSEFIWALTHKQAAELVCKAYGYDDADALGEVVLTVTLIQWDPPAEPGLVPEQQHVIEAFEAADLFEDDEEEE